VRKYRGAHAVDQRVAVARFDKVTHTRADLLAADGFTTVAEYVPHAVAAIRLLRVPMPLLQGGRDYQVTTADDLALWRAGPADRADVTVREFAADDHLFFPGTAPATPADVGRPQHVDPVVSRRSRGGSTRRGSLGSGRNREHISLR
jgi:hypothetical protein